MFYDFAIFRVLAQDIYFEHYCIYYVLFPDKDITKNFLSTI